MTTELAKKKKQCFIVTPIGSETDVIRRHIDGIIDAAIEPVLGDDYSIFVAHRLSNPGSINKQVIQYIYESDLVIANLTNNNPNVMYELAFRHCVGSPCIMIAEKGTILPFDISAERIIFYINDSKGVLELKDNLKSCVNSISFEDDEPNNPIYDNLKSLLTDRKIIESFKVNNEEGNEAILQYILTKIDSLNDTIARSSLGMNFLSKKIIKISCQLVGYDEESISNLYFSWKHSIINDMLHLMSIESNNSGQPILLVIELRFLNFDNNTILKLTEEFLNNNGVNYKSISLKEQ